MVFKVAFDLESANVFFTCSSDGKIRRYDLRERHVCLENCDNTIFKTYSTGSSDNCYSICMRPVHVRCLAAASGDGLLREFDIRVPGSLPCSFFGSPNYPPMASVAYNHFDDELIAGYFGGFIRLYQRENTHHEETFDGESFQFKLENQRFSGHLNQMTVKESNLYGHN